MDVALIQEDLSETRSLSHAESDPFQASAVSSGLAPDPPAIAAPPQSISPPENPASAQPIKSAHRPPAETPTQAGPEGLRFDFNDGCRLLLPQSTHPWKVRLSDLDTGNVL